MRLLAAALLFIPWLGMVEARHGGRIRTPPCPRMPERSFPFGSVTDIKDRTPPCRIEFRETGIRLDAVVDGSRPDPGPTVVVDSNGRFYSTNAPGWRAVITLWDSRGRYLSSFGGEGGGPGEFSARGALSLFVGGRDNLHVRHGFRGWSVFSPRQEFVGNLSGHDMGGGDWTTVILDDGSVLDGGARDGRPFRITGSTGSRTRTFGPAGHGSTGRGVRRISHAGGDAFWAGPAEEGGNSYVLEEWGIDGTLRRTLRRDVSWYRWRGHGETSTRVGMVHIAQGGLLYTVVFRPTDEYVEEYEKTRRGEKHGARANPREVRELEERMDALMEVVVEVIDTRSGELLASDVYRWPEARDIIPRDLFRGSLRGYRYKEGEGGLPFVEIVAVDLVAH